MNTATTDNLAMSPLRAWWEVVTLSIRRQGRMRHMVWIALALMAVAIAAVGMVTSFRGWNLTERRAPGRFWVSHRVAHERNTAFQSLHTPVPPASAVETAVLASYRAILDHSALVVFSRWVIFAILQGFLLPLWTLSFATDPLGNERESRTLIWLFTRPLPRPAVYVAKYVSAIPWCLGINLLGFVGICLAGGEPGRLAMRLYWPAVVGGTFAFAALFHLFAAAFRRPAVIGLIYSFFFETLVGDLPGDLKRLSIGYYVRSLMYHSTSGRDLTYDQLGLAAPATETTSWAVLAGATAAFTLAGMWIFARRDYHEDV